MTAPLTVRAAEITTAAVSINVLTVSGKQVTLAVYRQIVGEDCFRLGLEGQPLLQGEMWGTVNYHVGDDPFDYPGGHRHVVWQKGDQLRRCKVRCSMPSLNGYPRERVQELRPFWDALWQEVAALPQLFIAV